MNFDKESKSRKKKKIFFCVCVCVGGGGGGLVTGDTNMRAAIFCIHYTLS